MHNAVEGSQRHTRSSRFDRLCVITAITKQLTQPLPLQHAAAAAQCCLIVCLCYWNACWHWREAAQHCWNSSTAAQLNSVSALQSWHACHQYRQLTVFCVSSLLFQVLSAILNQTAQCTTAEAPRPVAATPTHWAVVPVLVFR